MEKRQYWTLNLHVLDVGVSFDLMQSSWTSPNSPFTDGEDELFDIE